MDDHRRRARGPVDLSDGLNRVRQGGGLVGPVAFHAREPQRKPSRVMRALLNVVERDLDDELRTNEKKFEMVEKIPFC